MHLTTKLFRQQRTTMSILLDEKQKTILRLMAIDDEDGTSYETHQATIELALINKILKRVQQDTNAETGSDGYIKPPSDETIQA